MFDFLFSNGLIEDIALALWGALVDWWWLVLPLALFFIAKDYWVHYNQEKFKEKIEWVNLELKVPRDVLTTPKAMEQIFAGLSSIASTPDTWLEELLDKKIPYKKGEVPLWVSFEIVGNRNGISFIIHTPKKFQRLIETQFRSQYSQVRLLRLKITSPNSFLYQTKIKIFGEQNWLLMNRQYSRLRLTNFLRKELKKGGLIQWRRSWRF